MGMFDSYRKDLNDASTSRPRWEYIKPGNHVLKVLDIRGITTKKMGPVFMTSFEVVKSDSYETGAKVDHPIFLNQDFGPRNAKDLLVALMGLDGQASADQAHISAEDWGKVGDSAVAEPEKIRGRLVNCRAYTKQNAKPNKEGVIGSHTRTSFSPDAEVRKATLAKLSAKGK